MAGSSEKVEKGVKTEADCKAYWESQGKPLFGKIWTYDELQNAERSRFRSKRAPKDMKTPDCWPKDTVIDTGGWVFWLPEGWKQGMRTSAAGKLLKCFYTPENRRFWHKKDIEKFLGYELPSVEPVERDPESTKRVRYVTDEELIPWWPDEEEDWLPHDFRLCFRQLPTVCHRIYIPPGQDEGFLYQKELARLWVNGESPKLTSFSGSRFMAEIVAETTAKGTSKCVDGVMKQKESRKKRRIDGVKVAGLEDYLPCEDLALTALPPLGVPMSSAGDDVPPGLREKAADVSEKLLERGFPKGTGLLGVFQRSKKETHQLLDRLVGVYFQMPASFGQKPCFQQVLVKNSGLLCTGHYIFWSETRLCWQIGNLSSNKAGFAVCSDDCSDPAEASKPWSLLKESFLEAAMETPDAN